MRTILTSTSFVRSLALLTVSLSCACSAPADPQTQTETSDETAEDALTIAGATGDATFGNHGKLDSPFSLYVAPDGSFAGAHVVNGELVMERRTRDGAPLAGFASTKARVAVEKLGRPNGGWWPRHILGTTICSAAVEPNGVTYVVGYAAESTPSGHKTYSGFVAIASADGRNVGGFSEGLGIPDYMTSGQLPMCLPSARTGDGHLFVQFSIEPVSRFGFRAIVPLDPAAHSFDSPGNFRTDPAVTDYNASAISWNFEGPAISFGDGRIARSMKSVYATQGGVAIDTLHPYKQNAQWNVSFRSMSGDAAGELVLLTNDNHVEVYNSQGTKQSAFAFKAPARTSPSSPSFGASNALRDGSGRFWIVFGASQVKNTPSMGAIMRFLPDGTPDASFATAFLTGSTVAERMLTAQVQGNDLIVGNTTPAGYSYVRIR